MTPDSGPDPRSEASSQPNVGVSAVLDSTSLGPDACTSASSGTSSNEAPGPDTSRTGKRLKLEASDVEEFRLEWPRAVSEAAAVDSPASNTELPALLSLDDESAHTVSGTAASTPPGVPRAQSDSPPSPISLRSLSAPPTPPIITGVAQVPRPLPSPTSLPPEPEPLHTYACPICFASPTNATLTPCGHIMCGECLFTAVGSAVARMGIASLAARCPVCRAPIPKWDGRGGGVIGLQPRVVITI
ncbi:hypothetical protein EI94DRAFT_1299043 [Lactarius quietus]|nr:hypothetical protein EI94DRAFT_1299043 [Lactarius quietus]